MISFSAQAPLRAGPHGGSAERFRDGRCQRAPRPAYLRDSVLEGQLLPLHTFVEGEDESDVVSICLPRRGRGGTKRRLSDTPTPYSPAGSQLTQLPNRSRLPRLPIQQQEQQKRNANCPTPTLRPKPDKPMRPGLQPLHCTHALAAIAVFTEQPHELDTVTVPILHTGKPRRHEKRLAQGFLRPRSH